MALDIHKEYALAGGMNFAQAWLLQSRQIEIGKFDERVMVNLRVWDAVVIETT